MKLRYNNNSFTNLAIMWVVIMATVAWLGVIWRTTERDKAACEARGGVPFVQRTMLGQDVACIDVNMVIHAPDRQ